MKAGDLINDLKKKIYQPVYFLYGKEAYFIDLISDYISDYVLPPEEQAFNQFIFYGKDSDLLQIIGQAKKFPMMSNHQVIIIREAQGIKGLTSAPTKNKANPLLQYCKNPVPSTILVVCVKTPPDSSDKLAAGFIKELGSKTVVFESKPLYDNELPAWVQQYAQNKQYKITHDATELLIESVGNSLTTLAREIEKLIIALPADQKEITDKLVEKNIGVSREYSIFELQNHLASGRAADIMKITHNLSAKQGEKTIFFIDKVFDFFLKTLKYYLSDNKSNESVLATEIGVNRYFLKTYASASKRYPPQKILSAFSLLREYDMKCKGVGASDDKGELFKELITKILYIN